MDAWIKVDKGIFKLHSIEPDLNHGYIVVYYWSYFSEKPHCVVKAQSDQSIEEIYDKVWALIQDGQQAIDFTHYNCRSR